MKGNVVYIHRNHKTGNIFYVGIGNNRGRAYSEYSRPIEWYNIVNKDYFDVQIIATGLSRADAYELEEFTIQTIGYNNLTNKTLGGPGFKSRHKVSSRNKISKSTTRAKKSKEWVDKYIESRRKNNSKLYINKYTGEEILGLKWACEKYKLNYKLEHQRISRGSKKASFMQICKEVKY